MSLAPEVLQKLILIDWVVFKTDQSSLSQQLSTQDPPEALGISTGWRDTWAHPQASACLSFATTSTPTSHRHHPQHHRHLPRWPFHSHEVKRKASPQGPRTWPCTCLGYFHWAPVNKQIHANAQRGRMKQPVTKQQVSFNYDFWRQCPWRWSFQICK